MILKDLPRSASILTEYEANQIKPKIGFPAKIIEIEDLSGLDRFVIQYGRIEKKEFIPIGFLK
jgi:hypothetical protein